MGVGRLVAGGDADRLGRLFRDMPAEVVGPEPAAVMAALRFAGDDPDEGAKHLARAEGLVDGSTSPQTVPLRLAAALLGAVAANQRHDAPEALAAADAAEALMAQAAPDRVAAHPELRALMLHCRGASQIWTGELDEAIRTLSEGVKAASVPSCDRPRFACMEQLALAHIYLGRLRDAADVAGKALELAKPRVTRRRARPSRPPWPSPGWRPNDGTRPWRGSTSAPPTRSATTATIPSPRSRPPSCGHACSAGAASSAGPPACSPRHGRPPTAGRCRRGSSRSSRWAWPGSPWPWVSRTMPWSPSTASPTARPPRPRSWPPRRWWPVATRTGGAD